MSGPDPKNASAEQAACCAPRGEPGSAPLGAPGQPAAQGSPSEVSIPGLQDAELASLAKALGHPIRAAILRYLQQHGQCVCGDIVAILPLAQSTVSQHLKILRSAGLLQGEVDGPRVCYCVDPETVRRLKGLIAGL